MQALPSFALQRPSTLADAAVLLAADPQARVLAGGTDLLPNLRHGLGAPTLLVDLSGIQDLDTVEIAADGSLRLGARLTLARLAADARLAARLPALAEAARAVAATGHRTAATLGGNLCQDTRCVFYNQSAWWRQSNGFCLKREGTVCHVAPQGQRCHAAFCSDLAPVLLALAAEVELHSARGRRRLPLQDLYRDDGAAHLALEPGELLACVHIPAPTGGLRCAFAKARTRGGIDFPLAAVAVALALDNGKVTTLRVGLAGTNSAPLLLQDTVELLGARPDADWQQGIGKLVQRQVSPMRSTATPAHYRRQVAVALVQRLLRQLTNGEEGG